MKKIYLAGISAILIFASCNNQEADQEALVGDGNSNNELVEDPLNKQLTTTSNISEAFERFSEGGATNAAEYFTGIQSGVVEVDIKLREIVKLDEVDANKTQFYVVLDTILAKINRGRKAINLYTDKTWPLRAEFHAVTEEWYTAVEGLVTDFYRDLAEPMSRPDDTWSQEELDFYEEYIVAYDAYIDLDIRWVEFQYTYAKANGFEIQGSIDSDSMVEEGMVEGIE